jgi:SPP1 gp7 family putative phage head morphogenesis protein
VSWRLLDAWDSKAWGELTLKGQFAAEERLAATTIRALFLKQRDEILEVIGAKKAAAISVADVLETIRSADKYFADAMRPEINSLIEERGSQVMGALGVGDDSFDMFDPAVVEFAENHSFKFARDVNEATESYIQDTLARAIEDGDSFDEIASKIKSTYDGWVGEDGTPMEETRAMRIARTETHNAQEFGTFEAFGQSEVVDGKAWMSLGDSAVRESHNRVDGEIVSLDSRFSNGLMYPGDSSVSLPAEVVNCRCTIQPAIREDD